MKPHLAQPSMPALHALVRLLPYAWSAPTTLLGLAATSLTLATGGRARVVRGVLEVEGGVAALFLRCCTGVPGGADALTLGHVVLGRSAGALERTRAHERAHVRQAERWGPLFLPAYAVASLLAVAAGRHAYRDNAFERAAEACADAACEPIGPRA